LSLDARPVELGGETLAEALLAPHRCYAGPVLPLLAGGDIHAMAHITGGGFVDNIPRVMPAGVGVEIDRGAWEVSPLFGLIQRAGGVDEREMFRVFNMGIGFVLVVAREAAETMVGRLTEAGERACVLGRVAAGTGVAFTS